MTDATLAVVRDLSEPSPTQPDHAERHGELVSSSPIRLELKLADGGPPIAPGALLKVQTGQTAYLGHVEGAENLGQGQRLAVRVGHWLSLQEVSFIQNFWSQHQSD